MKNNLSRILPVALIATAFTLTTAAHAQYTESILYSFGAIVNDGWNPGSGPIADAQGNLYGTTGLGGAHDLGSVYELSPNSTGGWTETVLYSFAGGTDGAYPNQLTFDTDGNLFGTTFYGGKSGGSVCGNLGCGTLFELSPSSGGWSEQVLYRFQAGTGGYFPDGKLVFDSNGNLFGTTYDGGAHGYGTVYELSQSSSGWTFNLVMFLEVNSTGAFPTGALTIDSSSNLYVATYAGGNSGGSGSCGRGCGTVFRLSPASGGTWTFTKLFVFFGAGGATPGSHLTLDAAGNLYGSTTQGGLSTSVCYAGGCGVIYKLTPTATGYWKESLLHQFTGGEDGFDPATGITLDSAGNAYGTAQYGGPRSSNCGSFSCGTAFKLTAVSGGWEFSRLLGFVDALGFFPQGPVILDSVGNVFGTTQAGGPTEAHCPGTCGVVYELSPPAGTKN